MLLELSSNPALSLTNVAVAHNKLTLYKNHPGLEKIMYSLTKSLRENRCRYCGKPLTRSSFTLDHMYPRYMGGISITNNLFPCCHECNQQKGSMNHEDFLIFKSSNAEDRKDVLSDILQKQEEIRYKNGFDLPDSWISYESLGSINYSFIHVYNGTMNYKSNPKYIDVRQFYKKYGKLPEPVIIDSNNRPLSGFEVLIFAHNRAIATIPVVKLDNVVAYNR